MTKEEIESVWSDVYRAYEQHTPNIYPEAVARLRTPFDMALQSLSQESVRSEALEEAAKVCEEVNCADDPGTRELIWFCAAITKCAEAIRALKNIHSTELRK